MGNCSSEEAAPKQQAAKKAPPAATAAAKKAPEPAPAPKPAPVETKREAPVEPKPEVKKEEVKKEEPKPEPPAPKEEAKPTPPPPVVEPTPEPVKEEPKPEPVKEEPKPEPVPEPEPEEVPLPDPIVTVSPPEPEPEPEPEVAAEPEPQVDTTIEALPTVEVQGPDEDDDKDLAKSAPAVEVTPAPVVKEVPLKVEERGNRKVRTLDLEGVKAMISTSTEKYQLGERLGKGAYGVVVRAKNTETGEDVAVKKISKEVLAKEGEAGEKRLYREVAIMGSLNHPNLVNLVELLNKQDTNEVWIVLEIVEGVELMNKIDRETKLTEKLARTYFQQLVCGIHYVHSQGVVHRDLKPENIMVTHEDVCKITDFGLSNVQNTDTMGQVPQNLNMQTCCGTPYYVAPEVVTRKTGYSGFTADVWSLGIILYVMLVGDLPFTAKDLRSLLRKIGKGDYKIPEAAKLSSNAKDLITQILNPKAEERITLQKISEHPWFVEGGFDAKRMEVNDNGVDSSAVDLLQETLGSWGAAKKKVQEETTTKAKSLALGKGGDNRAKFQEMTKNMPPKRK
eukprot:TRINITY_DN273_c2_g2_i1.p2 TRINITY_DN273_c2_g2~~TRINITY_DN273_c2_g2_i1.p2  ORF type:complete len:563 (+),score=293.72 TRINITY_DN273_c2_g2_i1:58-1746(+)